MPAAAGAGGCDVPGMPDPPCGAMVPRCPPYDSAAPVEGFLTGYQTMDTIAALNFGIVIVMNIRALG